MNEELIKKEKFLPKPESTLDFDSLIDVVSDLVSEGDIDEGDRSYSSWDGAISNFELDPELSREVGLGDKVQCRVIGDSETGIAFILGSRNIFNTRKYGFYAQPVKADEDNPRDFEIWQAPAKNPKRGEVYFGFELLDPKQAQLASSEVSTAFVRSLQRQAQLKEIPS